MDFTSSNHFCVPEDDSLLASIIMASCQNQFKPATFCTPERNKGKKKRGLSLEENGQCCSMLELMAPETGEVHKFVWEERLHSLKDLQGRGHKLVPFPLINVMH